MRVGRAQAPAWDPTGTLLTTSLDIYVANTQPAYLRIDMLLRFNLATGSTTVLSSNSTISAYPNFQSRDVIFVPYVSINPGALMIVAGFATSGIVVQFYCCLGSEYAAPIRVVANAPYDPTKTGTLSSSSTRPNVTAESRSTSMIRSGSESSTRTRRSDATSTRARMITASLTPSNSLRMLPAAPLMAITMTTQVTVGSTTTAMSAVTMVATTPVMTLQRLTSVLGLACGSLDAPSGRSWSNPMKATVGDDSAGHHTASVGRMLSGYSRVSWLWLLTVSLLLLCVASIVEVLIQWVGNKKMTEAPTTMLPR